MYVQVFEEAFAEVWPEGADTPTVFPWIGTLTERERAMAPRRSNSRPWS
jgi:hypothetical protein